MTSDIRIISVKWFLALNAFQLMNKKLKFQITQISLNLFFFILKTSTWRFKKKNNFTMHKQIVIG